MLVVYVGVKGWRRHRAGAPFRSQWGTAELITRAAATYLVFMVPQISHTVLTTPNPCQVTDAGEGWRLLFLLVLVPTVGLLAMQAPQLVPGPRPIARTEAGWPTLEAWKALGKGAVAVVLLAHGAEMLLWLLTDTVPWLTLHALAIGEMGVVVVLIALVGRIIDYIVPSTAQRLAGLAIAVPTIFLAYGAALRVDDVEPTGVARHQWFESALARLDAMPPDGPVVLVAASGGGFRAAMFAALVLETLALPPEELQIVRGDGLPASVNWKHPLSEYVFAISSVSGGSVAAAEYVASRSPIASPGRRARAGGGQWPSVLAAAVERTGQPIGKRLVDNAVVGAMMTDFNAVAVHGFLSMRRSRGRALSDFWEAQFAWSERIGGAPLGSVPLLLINATLLESGRPLVIGYPPVPQRIFDDAGRAGALRLPATVAERITRVSSTRLLGDVELPVAQAVRLSASFPFGMDAGRLTTIDGRALHVSDGGVVDNTGTGTLRELIQGIRRAADEDPVAAEVACRIGARGILMIEIDSGAKPLPDPGLLGTIFAPAMQSLTVMKQAAFTGEREAVELRRTIMQRGGWPMQWATFSYCPRDGAETVMTAWALGPDDEQSLMEQFLSNTLTGSCSRRPVPGLTAAESDSGGSPLDTIAASFQESTPPAGDALELLKAAVGRPMLLRLGLAEIDHDILADRDELAVQVAEKMADPDVVNYTVTLSGSARGLALGSAGRVYTVDADEERSGWFAAARYTDGALDWCVLTTSGGSGLAALEGRWVYSATPVLIHRGGTDGFEPLEVVAVAERDARFQVVARKMESVGNRDTVYLSVKWRDEISEPAPCTGVQYSVIACAGDEARAEAMITSILDRGHLRRACVRTTIVDQPARSGDYVDDIPGISGDVAALALSAGVALGVGPLPRVPTTGDRESVLAVHLCSRPAPEAVVVP